jgi:hypothetical protein
MVAIKKYIPNFLLPTDKPQTPGPIYDVPVRHDAVSASRNNSVVNQDAERRRSSAVSQGRRESWHPGMAFQGMKERLHL